MTEQFQDHGGDLYLMREIVRTHQVLMNTFSRVLGIPPSRFMLMKFLATAENGVGVTELAAKLGVSPAAVARLVKEMEDERFVVRRGDSRDGRRNYISLSAKGIKLVEQLQLRGYKLECALASFIEPEEIVVATRVLAKLRDFMGSIPASESVSNAPP
jgi:DNA-binding MarR family transcriptional regulator